MKYIDESERVNSLTNTLLLFYRRHNLTDYLQCLTDEELLMALDSIVVDRIDKEKGAILDTINQELEYRNDRLRQEKSSVSHKR